MINRGYSLAVPLFAAVFAAASLPVPAGAQSQNDLRRENQRLKTEVEDLQKELDAARAEIQALKEELERLRQAATGTAAPVTLPAAEPEPEIVTIDESVPSASPRALLNAIKASYAEATADLEMGDSEDAPERGLYLRSLNRWVARTHRQFKAPIEWHVEMVDRAVPVGRGFVMRMQAVDPETGVRLGDPFDALLSRSLSSRLQQRADRFDAEDVMVLKGVLQPRVQINPDRYSEGPFDNPRFVGPFAEFNCVVMAQTILPAPEPEEEEEGETGEEQPDG